MASAWSNDDTIASPNVHRTYGSAQTRGFHDRVFLKPRAHRAAVPPGTVRTLTAPDGTQIQVETSPSYADNAANQQAAQNTVNFLATRVHGSELAKLRVYIGKPAEIHTQCGSDQAVACYYLPESRMYVPGEVDPSGIPTEYVITHEYGHHIAANRLNQLGPELGRGISQSEGSFLLGPEYWSSFAHVCSGVTAGQFAPGDQDQGYLDNPGEGWADAYAHLPDNGFSDIRFQFNQAFRPTTEEAYAAIRRDVLQPWTGPTLQNYSGKLGGSSRKAFTQDMTLDGVVVAKLTGPSKANFDLQVLVDGKVVDKSKHAGSRERIGGRVCAPQNSGRTGAGPITFRVVRRSGSGSFALKLSYPG